MAAETITWDDKDKTQPKGSAERSWRDTDANEVKQTVNNHAQDLDDIDNKTPEGLCRISVIDDGESFESIDRGVRCDAIEKLNNSNIRLSLTGISSGFIFISITPATGAVRGTGYSINQGAGEITITAVGSGGGSATSAFENMLISIESF